MAKTLPGLKHWHFNIDFEKIAWATFDQAGESTNSFGRETATELDTIVTAQEGELLRERERLVAKVIAVDHFDPDEITGKSAIGHNSRPANAFDKPPHAASSEEIHAAE